MDNVIATLQYLEIKCNKQKSSMVIVKTFIIIWFHQDYSLPMPILEMIPFRLSFPLFAETLQKETNLEHIAILSRELWGFDKNMNILYKWLAGLLQPQNRK